MSISKDELLKGRDKQYANEYSQEISDNLDKLLIPLNKVRDLYGIPMVVSSGWRPPSINATTPGAAAHSAHCIGLAADIQDLDGKLKNWVLENLPALSDLGFYFEDFRWTPNWVHFGLQRPASGKRIFVPSAARPQAPDRWDGNYDHSLDN